MVDVAEVVPEALPEQEAVEPADEPAEEEAVLVKGLVLLPPTALLMSHVNASAASC